MLYSEIEDKIENASDVDILKEQLQQAEKNIKMQEQRIAKMQAEKKMRKEQEELAAKKLEAEKKKRIEQAKLAAEKREAEREMRKEQARIQMEALLKKKKEEAKLQKEQANRARETAESQKTGRPKFEDLIDVWYQSANGGWKDSAKFMIGRFFEDGLPENQTSHSDTVWLNLLALYILDEDFPGKESQWVLIAEKAKTFLKRQGVSHTKELANMYYGLVEIDQLW